MEATGTLDAAAVKRHALAVGFDIAGVTQLRASDHAEFYRAWLAAGRHGEMAYLARADAVARRLDPAAAWPQLKSAIAVGLDYYPETETEAEADPSHGIIARYARGRDYHRVIRRKLLALLDRLETAAGQELPAARAYVDTGPVLERELARRAGLGWFGRNTMLIDPRRGSYFFLATLLVELELEPDAPFEAEHCGRCNACVEACPTGALLGRDATGAPVIDATRCISYLTIEHRGPIPRELRPLIGNRVFGCDICQEVCPFSIKFSQPSSDPSFAARQPGVPPVGVDPRASPPIPHPGTTSPSLIDLLLTTLDGDSWDSFSQGSAIRRAGRAGFARNVAVALGNWGDPSAVPALAQGLNDPEPIIRGHAAWALGRVGSPDAVRALTDALPGEEVPWVRAELVLALDDRSSSRK